MSTQTLPRLTDAQAEVIYLLHSQDPEAPFLLSQMFTARNNQDNGARRTLRRLVKMELVVPSGTESIDREPYYRLTREAIAAFRQYAIRVNYEFPWGGAE